MRPFGMQLVSLRNVPGSSRLRLASVEASDGRLGPGSVGGSAEVELGEFAA